ncbi:Pyruvate/Phosphoenolpyruvate kinase-like domain-containing protein [Mycena belliarum]|uniref:Pyruvate/Phosphoenolpyruvate kinase-like domain-containing protein n=1 Tax=Mycena belliarum TaxID=1033014 RepID=A0AAD6XLZ3_9AGAR|nr:Pyruvate/Phosphoenolpyruvate kinase-like domain-containing protein [Mycena belliae]
MSAPAPQFTLDAATVAQYRAPTLSQPANFQGLLKSGRILMGVALTFPSRHVAKALAMTNADWCWLDTEHTAWNQRLLVECIQIIIHESGGRMVPVVRVPSKTAFDYMAWSLDAGAAGIIIPHMETAEEMKEVVAACRFPPIGHRSYPPWTFLPGVNDKTPEGDTVFTVANRHVAIIPQIESKLGIKNLAEIVAHEQVSAFMIGPGDLRLDMGLPNALAGDEPAFVEAMATATKVAKERDIPIAGFAVGPEMTKMRIDQGFRMLMTALDLYALVFGIMTDIGTAKAVAEAHILAKK